LLSVISEVIHEDKEWLSWESSIWICCESWGWQKASSNISYITESQNHRMFGVGRDLCGSSSLTTLPK